jgi:hypothetical protein
LNSDDVIDAGGSTDVCLGGDGTDSFTGCELTDGAN